MQTEINKQEIILVKTAVTAKSFFNRNGPVHRISIHADRMKDAVWDGMLGELLGDTVKRNGEGEPLTLWQVRQGDAILEIELCDYPHPLERGTSIDPYVFMYGMLWN